ncbi:EscT/YscT/HrcT family type III secretion system export apparatus protein [Thalassococcus sp. S3]|uniref:EscT/YscT/HrcT family type III secretion system export apparatus protein n=1 Tax=Thalassococcus sp. S3 TaxID=2017482 RepID=UPI001023FD7C|nr:flagellar biosynthetic protein FliR [Thalassococcus sp. S3]QBF33403.1 hypothetical protein CFI11_19625 [Thalassococcus sp. S3]
MSAFDFDLLNELSQAIWGPIGAIALLSGRIYGLMLVFPLFTRVQLGRTTKGAIAIALALPLQAPMSVDMLNLDLSSPLQVAFFSLKEAAVGALMGLFMGAPIFAIRAAGDITDTQREIVNADTDDPSAKSQATASGTLFGFIALALFVSSGGMETLVGALYGSYEIWPLNRYMPAFTTDSFSGLIRMIHLMFLSAMALAAPFIVLFLITDLSVAGLGKVAPNMVGQSTGAAFKNLIFAVFILAYASTLLGYMREALPTRALVLFELERMLTP